jgi:hypothetical protein
MDDSPCDQRTQMHDLVFLEKIELVLADQYVCVFAGPEQTAAFHFVRDEGDAPYRLVRRAVHRSAQPDCVGNYPIHGKQSLIECADYTSRFQTNAPALLYEFSDSLIVQPRRWRCHIYIIAARMRKIVTF